MSGKKLVDGDESGLNLCIPVTATGMENSSWFGIFNLALITHQELDRHRGLQFTYLRRERVGQKYLGRRCSCKPFYVRVSALRYRERLESDSKESKSVRYSKILPKDKGYCNRPDRLQKLPR